MAQLGQGLRFTQGFVVVLRQLFGPAAFLQGLLQGFVGFIKAGAQGFKFRHKGGRGFGLNAFSRGLTTGNQLCTFGQIADRAQSALGKGNGQNQRGQNSDCGSRQHDLNRLLPALVEAGCRFSNHGHPARCAINGLEGKHDLMTFQCLGFEGAAFLLQFHQSLPVGHGLANQTVAVDRAPNNATRAVGDCQDDGLRRILVALHCMDHVLRAGDECGDPDAAVLHLAWRRNGNANRAIADGVRKNVGRLNGA